ncbi:MAG: ABC transporter ATP-binding protein [Acholeplasmataceae bacterium]
MAYLKFKNIKKVYDNKVTAVSDFNLDIKQGEFIVFLGPSGCGKTTTLRMIAGLEEVTEGEIILDGKSIVGLEPKDRGVSMIFQSYAVWPHMTVYDNIAYPLKLHKKSKQEVEKIVNDVAEISDIKEYLKRYPSQLSGGQRQRVAVARAIAINPKLFLMDEPLSNLDAKLRVTMRTELKRIHYELKSTSIFVTHDQSEALSLADRIVVMNKGKIEQIGSPNEIYHESETMFIAKFIGSPSSNFFEVKVIEKDNQIILKNKYFEFKYNGDATTTLKEKYLNKNIILSVRPEQITINEKNSIFKAKAIIIEPQGSHEIINSKVDDIEFKIVTNLTNIKEQEEMNLGFTDQVLLYDLETERRIK